MTRRIWKYEVPVGGKRVLVMPKGAKILRVGSASTETGVTFWADVDDHGEVEARVFIVHGTGHEIPRDHMYVGTVPLAEYGLVWHLFEVPASGRDAS